MQCHEEFYHHLLDKKKASDDTEGEEEQSRIELKRGMLLVVCASSEVMGGHIVCRLWQQSYYREQRYSRYGQVGRRRYRQGRRGNPSLIVGISIDQDHVRSVLFGTRYAICATSVAVPKIFVAAGGIGRNF